MARATSDRARDVRVGAFVLGALLLAVSGSLWIAGSNLVGAPRTPYEVTLADSAGLQAGDRVRVAGVSVGRIRSVTLRPGADQPVVLEISIRDEVPVRQGSTARIGTTGLLGTPHLEVDPGDPTGPRLPGGSRIPGGAPAGMEAALGRVDELAEEATVALRRTVELIDKVSATIDPLVGRLEAFLSDENARELTSILAGVRTNLDEAAPRLQATLESLEHGSARLEQVLEGAPELRERLAVLLDDLDRALGPEGERLGVVLDSAQATLDSAQTTFDAVGSRDELEALARDLRDTMANLKAFSQTLEERPYSLVRIKMPRDREPGDGVREGR